MHSLLYLEKYFYLIYHIKPFNNFNQYPSKINLKINMYYTFYSIFVNKIITAKYIYE